MHSNLLAKWISMQYLNHLHCALKTVSKTVFDISFISNYTSLSQGWTDMELGGLDVVRSQTSSPTAPENQWKPSQWYWLHSTVQGHFNMWNFQKYSHYTPIGSSNMMASLNGNIFWFTGPLCGEFTGDQWIPFTKAGDAKLSCFLWSVPE